MLPPVSMQRLVDAVGVVLELDAVVTDMESRVPTRGQYAPVGWSQAKILVRTRAIWLKIGNEVATGAE